MRAKDDLWSGGFDTALPGVYAVRIRAQGETLFGSFFTREQTLAAVAVQGGRPSPGETPVEGEGRTPGESPVDGHGPGLSRHRCWWWMILCLRLLLLAVLLFLLWWFK